MTIFCWDSPPSHARSLSKLLKKPDNCYSLVLRENPPDECVDERLRFLFADHDCRTARFASLAGLKNGRLLDAAEAAGFDVLITVDQSIPDQQNLSARKISIVILVGATNRLNDLTPLVGAALSAISSIEQGQVVRIQAH